MAKQINDAFVKAYRREFLQAMGDKDASKFLTDEILTDLQKPTGIRHKCRKLIVKVKNSTYGVRMWLVQKLGGCSPDDFY